VPWVLEIAWAFKVAFGLSYQINLRIVPWPFEVAFGLTFQINLRMVPWVLEISQPLEEVVHDFKQPQKPPY